MCNRQGIIAFIILVDLCSTLSYAVENSPVIELVVCILGGGTVGLLIKYYVIILEKLGIISNKEKQEDEEEVIACPFRRTMIADKLMTEDGVKIVGIIRENA